MEWYRLSKSNLADQLNKPVERILAHIHGSVACCRLCRQQADAYHNLCDTCFNDLSLFKYQHLDNNLLNWPAIAKALPNHQFDRLFCAAPYLWPFNQWLTQFKYQNHYELSQLLTSLVVHQWRLQHKNHQMQLESTAVIAVPIHFKQWQKRGYNQAHLLAKDIAKQLSLPYIKSLVSRIKLTTQQVGQTGSQRRKNLKGAFEINGSSTELPQHIILVDDVVTTGSTANEICTLLKQQGVETVTLLTVCLTLP